MIKSMVIVVNRYRKPIEWVIRLALGSLFILASLDKIWYPALFVKALSNYRILPLSMLHISAIALPWLELLLGMSLIFGIWTRTANFMIGALLVLFTSAIGLSLFRGLDFNCGCFDLGDSASNIGLLKILENLFWIGLSIGLAWLLPRPIPHQD